MKKLIAAISITVILSGCASYGSKSIAEQSNFLTVKVGQTDKQTTYSKFGQPHDVFTSGEKVNWRYIYTKTSPEPATFVLGVIIWPLAFFIQTQYEITQTDFQFDSAGNLIDVNTKKGEKSKGMSSVIDAFSKEQQEASQRVQDELRKLNLPFDEKQAKVALNYLSL